MRRISMVREGEAAPASWLGSGDGPRERLGALGAESLSDAELVALLLRTGGGGRDVLSLAASVLRESGGLGSMATLEVAELSRMPGIGPAKSAALVAALEIGRRVASRRLRAGDPVRGPADVFRHFHARVRQARHERFFVLLLDGRHRLLREVVISQGTLTASLVHPREVFRPALREAAAALVLVHNHPSGDPTPSTEDREITMRLFEAGTLIGVPVLDHVVVAERGWSSLCELGALPRRESADPSSVLPNAPRGYGR
jgi:DNA repair protein RadC